jgi:hypothetical protein
LNGLIPPLSAWIGKAVQARDLNPAIVGTWFDFAWGDCWLIKILPDGTCSLSRINEVTGTDAKSGTAYTEGNWALRLASGDGKHFINSPYKVEDEKLINDFGETLYRVPGVTRHSLAEKAVTAVTDPTGAADPL